jgi:hypothetical protein
MRMPRSGRVRGCAALCRTCSVYPLQYSTVHSTRTMAAILPLHLPDHLPTLLISTVGFATIHHLGAPEFARFLIGKKGWDALGSRDRVGWCVFVSPSLLSNFVIAVSWIARFCVDADGGRRGAGACTDYYHCNL